MGDDRDAISIVPLDDERWARLVSAADSTPFHHPAWAGLLAETYRYRSFALAVGDGNGTLTAGAPFLEVRSPAGRRRWISLPFTDECPPLALGDGERRALAVGLAAAQGPLRAPRIVVRAALAGVGWQTSAEAVTHELALDGGMAEVRRGFSRSQVVRNIKRAHREGVVVRRATTHDDLGQFYALHVDTRRRQGVPVQPLRFFELLWERLMRPGLGSILLADVGARRAVAGAVFLSWNGTTIYKFGASRPDALAHRPNHLIFATAIEEACARGDQRFDFGRTDLGNGGLRTFKSGWGALERPLAYSQLEPRATEGREGLAARALALAIRRGPSWLCRGAGQTLYRYAGAR